MRGALALSVSLLAAPYDASAQTTWAHAYSSNASPGEPHFGGACERPDGSLIVVGRTLYATDGAFAVSLDRTGRVLWWADYNPTPTGDDSFSDVVCLSDGSALIVGHATFGSSLYDAWIFKIDDLGRRLWSYRFQTSGDDHLQRPIALPDGGFVVAGSLHYRPWILRLNASGSPVWQRRVEVFPAYGTDIVTMPDGSFVLAVNHGIPSSELPWLLRIGSNGSLASGTTLSFGSSSYVAQLEPLGDGTIVAIGGNGEAATVTHLDASGNVLAHSTFPSASANTYALSAAPTPDGGLIVGGSGKMSPTSSFDGWIMKLDADLVAVWQKEFLVAGDGDQSVNAVVRLADGTYLEASDAVDIRRFDEAGQISAPCAVTGDVVVAPLTALPVVGSVTPTLATVTLTPTSLAVPGSIDYAYGLTKTCGQPDADADDVFDPSDNCPTTGNPDQLDTDGDDVGDACECLGVTCDDGDPCSTDSCLATTGGCTAVPLPVPGEASHVSFWSPSLLLWDEEPNASSYGVVRGDLTGLPVGPGLSDEICFGDLASPQVVDGSRPSLGSGYWYLARAENACGVSTFGQQSDGSPRNTTTCP